MITDEKGILAKFNELTKKLDPKEARIAVYKFIRDIPYAIIPELRDPDKGPAGILHLNKGSCQPKHYLLGMLFVKLDIPIQYMSYPFLWGSQKIAFPDDLKKIVKELPPAYHLACKAYIDQKWVLVDATHDLPLKKANFPVTEQWDGQSDTVNAVEPLEEIIHGSLMERVTYEAKQRGFYSEKEKASYAQFLEKLNPWLESVRLDRSSVLRMAI